jgi:hypothetical protein
LSVCGAAVHALSARWGHHHHHHHHHDDEVCKQFSVNVSRLHFEIAFRAGKALKPMAQRVKFFACLVSQGVEDEPGEERCYQ